jgi:TRAP transporter TAXI family solute receptor
MGSRTLVRTLAILLITTLAAGCGGRPGPGSVEGREGWPRAITIGSASIGGVYFLYAGGHARLISEKMGIPASVEVTGGPVHNMQLVNANETEIGYVTNAPALEGWTGEGWAKGKEYVDVRALFPMYPSKVHFYVLKSSGITSVRDLEGKTVGVGPSGGTPGTYLPLFLEVLGVKPSMVIHAGYSDLTSQTKDGLLDAVGWIGGIPLPSVLELEAVKDVGIVGFSPREIAAILESQPTFFQTTMSQGAYKSLDRDIQVPGVWNFAITHKDTPEDFVYELVKATFENVDILVNVHPSSKGTLPENIEHSVLPFHPGAVRYYREIGVEVPEALLPAEMK